MSLRLRVEKVRGLFFLKGVLIFYLDRRKCSSENDKKMNIKKKSKVTTNGKSEKCHLDLWVKVHSWSIQLKSEVERVKKSLASTFKKATDILKMLKVIIKKCRHDLKNHTHILKSSLILSLENIPRSQKSLQDQKNAILIVKITNPTFNPQHPII